MYSLVCAAVLWAIPRAQALPHSQVQEHEGLITRKDDSHLSLEGEPEEWRIYFTVFTMVCMMVLSLLLGSRFGRLQRNAFKNRNITSILVLFLYFVAIIFVLIMAILIGAQGINSYRLCKSTFWICAILYSIAKITVYAFLVERIRAVRAPFVHRKRDWVYIGCMITMILAFSFTVAYDMMHAITEFDVEDGRCHLGIPGKASIVTLAIDLCLNIGLTTIFLYLLLPIVRAQNLTFGEEIRRLLGKTETEVAIGGDRMVSATQRTIKGLIWKNLIGSVALNLPMIGIMIYFSLLEGRVVSVVCCSLCLLDVCWDAIVIYWLTFGSIKAEKSLHGCSVHCQRTDPYRALNGLDYVRVTFVEEPEIAHSPRTLRRFSEFSAFRKSAVDMVVPVKLDHEG